MVHLVSFLDLLDITAGTAVDLSSSTDFSADDLYISKLP